MMMQMIKLIETENLIDSESFNYKTSITGNINSITSITMLM